MSKTRVAHASLTVMHPTARSMCLAYALLLTVASGTASAQSRLYVGGTALADIKQFDSIQYDPAALASVFAGESRNGIAAGGGLRVGTFVHPLWSLELSVDAGRKTTSRFRNPFESLPTRSSTLRLPELSSSTSFLTVSTVVGFHPQRMGRVRLGYLGGLSFVRGTYTSTVPEFFPMPTVDVDLIFSGSLSDVDLSRLTFPVPSFTPRTIRQIDNSAGGILGMEAAIDATSRLAIVPGIRTIVFSNRGQSVFLIRPEVGVRWTF